MGSTSICRCCLTEGIHKDLNSTYIWHNKKEMYSDMLQECFNIVLCTIQADSSSICDQCVLKLRDAFVFRQQVLNSEEDFVKLIPKKETDNDGLPIKMELKTEDNSGDSDNCLLARIELEADSHDSVNIESTKSTVKRKNANCAKKNRVLQGISNITEPQAQMRTENKVKIMKPNVLAVPISRAAMERTKHRHNLQAVLKYSNAVPFKNWSLQGFHCSYCDKKYLDPNDLRSHTEISHKAVRLDLKTQSDLSDYHVKLDIAGLKCTICGESTKNLKVFKEHLMNAHDIIIHKDIKDHLMEFVLKGDIFDCAMCPSQYETFKMLKQHMNRHYDNYICQTCGATFFTKRSLIAHKTTHSEGSFKCDLCEKIFPSRTKKLYHEKSKHLGNRSISNCPFCDEPFRSYYQRNQHMVKVHNSEAQYKCNICSKAYILKSLLMNHIKKSHLMEKNFQCSECGFKFFCKKALHAHMVKHSGEKKYKCEVCHKAYARKYTLREHMRIHNDDRRFKCEVCANAFVQKCTLKAHLLSHHGISMAASEITVS